MRSQNQPVLSRVWLFLSLMVMFLSLILRAHEYTNPEEVPWITTSNQSLCTLLKTIQWRFLDTYDDTDFLV